MTYKIYIVFLFFLFLTTDVFSQTKKEIISSLLEQVDSLNQVVASNRVKHKDWMADLNERVDSLKSTLNSNRLSLLDTQVKLDKYELELAVQKKLNDKQSNSLDSLKRECDKLNQRSDYLEALIEWLKKKHAINLFFSEMVFVEGGTFQMGSNSLVQEKPVHSVTLSSFYIGKYEVTQAQWKAVMGSNPSRFQGCDQCPVESVSWNDAQDFIRKLNEQTGKNYRLPTEAEWEYAARGGSKCKGSVFSGSNDVSAVAWYYSNSLRNTHPAGGKHANELGIYDMSGNVWEWCSNFYDAYRSYDQTNPWDGNAGLNDHILRGGSWRSDADCCRNAFRNSNNPNVKYDTNGFRLVLPVIR